MFALIEKHLGRYLPGCKVTHYQTIRKTDSAGQLPVQGRAEEGLEEGSGIAVRQMGIVHIITVFGTSTL